MASILKWRDRKQASSQPDSDAQAPEAAVDHTSSTEIGADQDASLGASLQSAETSERRIDKVILPTAPGTSQRVPGGVAGLTALNLDDLAEAGKQQLQRYQQHAEKIVVDANTDAARIRQKAYDDGFATGQKEGNEDSLEKIRAIAEEKARDQVAALTQAAKTMQSTYNAWMQDYRECLVATAVHINRRLIDRYLVDGFPSPNSEPGEEPDESDSQSKGILSELIIKIAEEALHSTRSAQRLTLAVHPYTLAELGDALDELLSDPSLPDQSVVVPDESVRAGDVVVRQDGGEIHAGLREQLERLAEELA